MVCRISIKGFALPGLVLAAFLVIPLATSLAWARDISALQAGAEQGDAHSQYELGRAYEAGAGLPQDDFEAVRWFKAAAAQDHPQASLEYGWMLANGYGLPKDVEQAYFWFARAAFLGVEQADIQRDAIGMRLGEQVRKELYRKAARSLPQVRPAQEAPLLTHISDPVLQPHETFEMLRHQLNNGGSFILLAKLRILAKDGDPRAANLMGLALRRSTNPEDRAAGLAWMYSAARAGLPAAQYNLARAGLDDRISETEAKTDYQTVRRWLDMAHAGSIPAAFSDYEGIAREFAARAGLTDPYRAAIQGSEGAYPELRQLIEVARQDLRAWRELDSTTETSGSPGVWMTTTIIE